MIDRRVSRLIQLLHEEGLSWLATEIVETIERGKIVDSEIDWNVDDERQSTHEKADRKHQTKDVWDGDEMKSHAWRAGAPIPPDDQIELAVELLIDRLKLTISFLSDSQDILSQLYGDTVELQVTTDDNQVSTLDVERAKEAMSTLESLREALLDELRQNF